jgi:hypothetical protein
MSVFVARRRAEEFDSLVEGGSTGTAPGGRYADQLELVAELRALPRPEPRPEFTADLRAQLLEAADTLLIPSQDAQRLTLPPRRTARDRRVAAAVGGLAVVGATTSLAVAAQSALPGEMLYPLKRVIESAGTEIHASDEGRGQALLANAVNRLEEAAALSRSGDADAGANVEQALLDFADQATLASDLLLADYAESGDPESVEELRRFTADSIQALADLQPVLPDVARDELRYAVEVIDRIDDAAALACPSCSGGISQIPPVLLSAGQVAEPVIVVPSTLLPATTIRQGEGRGTSGGQQDGSQSGTDEQDSGPLSTLGEVTGTDGSGGGGPLSDLTDGLTGQSGGDAPTSGGGGGGGLTGVPEVDEPVDDVVDGVDGTLEDVDDALPDLP